MGFSNDTEPSHLSVLYMFQNVLLSVRGGVTQMGSVVIACQVTMVQHAKVRTVRVHTSWCTEYTVQVKF